MRVEVMPMQKGFSTPAELILFKDENPQAMAYTSLRDLMSTNCHVCIKVHSSSGECTHEDKEEEERRPAIKNRLVELAARAYLLPSHAERIPANQFFSRQWARFTTRPSWLHCHDQSNLNVLQSTVPCLPSPLWVDITRAFLLPLQAWLPEAATRSSPLSKSCSPKKIPFLST